MAFVRSSRSAPKSLQLSGIGFSVDGLNPSPPVRERVPQSPHDSDGLSGLPRFRTLGKQSGRLCAVVPLVQKRSERPNHLSLLTRAKIRRSSAAYCKSVLQDLPHRPDIQTLQSHRLRGFAQLEFLHLAGRGFGDFCKHHIARTFVAGEVRTAPGDQLFGGGA
jgi:hypothetical protein